MLHYLLPVALILVLLIPPIVGIILIRRVFRRIDEHLKGVEKSILLHQKNWLDLTPEELELWGEALKSQGEKLLSRVR